MAIQIIDSGNRIERNSNVVAASSNYTCIFWNKLVTKLANDYVLFLTIDDLVIYSQLAAIFGQSSPNDWVLDVTIDSFGTTGQVLDGASAAGNWQVYSYTRIGNTHSFYVNGILIGSTTYNVSAASFLKVLLGDDGTSEGNTQQFCNFREWNTGLSITQINTEINSPFAVVHTANLITFTPLTSDLLDVSGNGNDWTQVGSVSFVSDPSFPTNTTFATAQNISSLPASISVSAALDTYVFDLWYKYTTLSTDDMLSAYPSGGFVSGSHYLPQVSTYNSSQQRLIYNTSPVSVVNQPNFTVGATYYFLVEPGSARNIVPAALVFSLESQSAASAPTGTPLIISDSTDLIGNILPAAILDKNNNNTVLRFQPFPAASEFGTTLPDGTMGVGTDESGAGVNNNILILNTAFTVLHTVAIPGLCRGITSDQDDTFYVMYRVGSDNIVQKLSKSGVLDGTLYHLGSTVPRSLCVKLDNSILYYGQAFNNTTIKRWDLIGNSALSNLFTGSSHLIISDMFVVPSDGSIMSGDATSGSIYRIDASLGTIIQTYTLPAVTIGADDRMCLGIGGDNFWYWNVGPSSPIIATLFNIKISDGSILTNKTYNTFSESIANEGSTLTPTSRFGPENSCPMLLTQQAFGPGDVSQFGGLYTLVPGLTHDVVADSTNLPVSKIINWFAQGFLTRDK